MAEKIKFRSPPPAIKLAGEYKRKRTLLSQNYIYWPCALFFLWGLVAFAATVILLKNMGFWSGWLDPVCYAFLIPYAILGPACSVLIMRTSHMTKFLWAITNATVCPLAVILWLFLIAQMP